MAEEASTSSGGNLIAAVEHGSKAIVLLGAMAYVIGLFVTNLRAASFGFPAPSLAQPRYVLSGALWLFLITATGALLAMASYIWVSARADWRNRKRALAFAKVFGIPPVLAGTGVIVMMLSPTRFDILELDTWKAALLMLSTVLTLRPVASDASNVWAVAYRRVMSDNFDIGIAIFRTLFQIALCMLLITAYAVFAYPKIPSALGGGLVSPVRILPSDEGANRVSKLGLRILADGLTEPVTVVYESDDYFFVVRTASGNDHRGRRVAKSLIEGDVQIEQ